MNELPTRAGQAVLEYSSGIRAPQRDKEVIKIPATRGGGCMCGEELEAQWMFCPGCGGAAMGGEITLLGELIPLMDNYEQFLYRQTSDSSHFKDTWFGGTDEAPFLVKLDPWAYNPYRYRGSEGFYTGIIPSSMKTMALKWGGEWKRQGDIFAYSLPITWAAIKDIGDFTKGRKGLRLFEVEKESVLDTRHNLQGRWCQLMCQGKSLVIAEGVLTAPDHAPMVLDGPHALDQTTHLDNPAKAD